MITFPLSTLLIPYAIIALFVAIIAMFTIFHFVKYSETTVVSFIATFIYLAGTAYILFFTWQSLKDADWGYPVEIRTAVMQSNADAEFSL